MNTDKMLPCNPEAERWFLAGLLHDNKNIDAYLLEKEDFYSNLNATIYTAIKTIVKKNKVTWEVLISALKPNAKLYNYFIDLDINCPEHNCKFHYDKIKSAAIRRKQIELAYKIFNDAYQENSDTESTIDELKAVMEKSKTRDETGIVQVSELFSDIDNLYEKGLEPGLSTGWLHFDQFYTVKSGQITVITGVPSHGKTNFNTNLIANMAQRHHWKFAVFSPENYPMQRYCAHVAQIYGKKPFGRGNNERISPAELEPIKYWIDEHFVFIVPRSDEMRIDNLIQKATICVLKHGVKGIVFDPWNEIDHTRPQGLHETEYISKCLSKLRYFARTYDVHIWLIAHPTKMIKRLDGTYPVPTPYDISGCYSGDTEVLTDKGWLLHEKIKEDDKICCFDTTENNLSYLDFSKKWEYGYKGNMINLNSPSFDLLITPNHRVVVRPDWRDKPSFKSKVKWNGIGRPATHKLSGWSFVEADKLKSDLRMPFATKLIDCSDYPITDTDLKIIGWWITEGWESMGSIAFCQASGDLADKMLETVKSSDYIFTVKINKSKIVSEKPIQVIRFKNRYCEKTKEFTKMILNQCGIGCQNKELPSFTWQLSFRQKQILFKALMEGDGSKGRGDSFRFATSSTKLVNDIQRLSVELGRMASFSSQSGVCEHHKRRYQINIGQTKRNTITLNMQRHKSMIKYSGKVYCLTVPTGAYVTRRNGKVSICGNSAHFRNKADNCLTVWRDLSNPIGNTTIYIQKIRFHEVGKIGEVKFHYKILTQSYDVIC